MSEAGVRHENVERLAIEWLPGRYAVCRLEPDWKLPYWAQGIARDMRSFDESRHEKDVSSPADMARSPLLSITRTERELSIVIDETQVPPDVKAQHGFIAMRIVGTLDFSLVGILSRLTGALAAAGIPVFAISTFDTDVLLVPSVNRDAAEIALAGVARFARAE